MLEKHFVAALFAVAATPSMAMVSTYECTLNSRENHGWVSKWLIFSVDEDARKAVVLDSIIQKVEDAPLQSKFKTKSNGKQKLSWSVQARTSTGRDLKVNYEAVFNPSTQTVRVDAWFPLRNNGNNPSGTGTCNIANDKTLF